MLKPFRLTALAAIAVPVLALSACGGGVPGNSVATIGEQTIERSTFDHWMKIAAIASASQQGAAATPKTVPDAPDFSACIAETKKVTTPAKGQPEPTEAALKTQCKSRYDSLKTEVLSFLIRATWLDQEAAAQKVTVADKDVKKQVDDIRKQQYPNDRDWQKFLQTSGLANADILFQQRSSTLQQKITTKVTKGKSNVTDAQISANYEKNKSKYATPESRDLRVVLTKEKATADKAKAALASGQSWAAVAKRYSIDETSKSSGGKLPGVSKGQQEKALDTAVFAATKNKLSGPVKTQFGWYVFEVTKITAGKQQSLAQSKDSIKQQLSTEGTQKALTAFGKDYAARYKAKTDCRKNYLVSDCKGGPKEATTTQQQTQQGTATDQGATTTQP